MMGPHDLLLVVDVQNDFCPGGNLPVADGHRVVPVINRLLPRFRNVVLTQDWHPSDHASFASMHAGKSPYDTISMPYGEQTLWPDHCIQGSEGASFHPDLETDGALAVIRKGMNASIDSYSAFTENDRSTPTGLGGLLGTLHIQRVFLVGLAFDFCVGWSASDARAGPHLWQWATENWDVLRLMVPAWTLLVVVYATFFAGLFRRLETKNWLRMLVYAPLVLGLIDLGENVQVIAMLAQYPDVSPSQVATASAFTVAKGYGFAGCIGYGFALLLIAGAKRLFRRSA